VARDPVSCSDKAAELLAIRPHFEAELRRKLIRRRYPEDEVEATLSRFCDLGYLDDEASARSFVDSRLRRGPVGRMRLSVELRRRGVAGEIVADVVGQISDDDELERARVAAERWSRRQRSSGSTESPDGGRPDAGRIEALGRHLGRKGFEKRVILEVLQSLGVS
jgi:regulatory protein